MSEAEVKILIKKYLDNTITKGELEIFLREIESYDLEKLDGLFQNEMLEDSPISSNTSDSFNKQRVLSQILKETSKPYQPFYRRPVVFLRAAIVLIILSFSFWLFQTELNFNILTLEDEIYLSQGNQAVVSFKDGTAIEICQANQEALSEIGLSLHEDSELGAVYKVNPISNNKYALQTFTSPRGSSSILMLSDGTKVWLNSASKITYPSSFSDSLRGISIQGEGYFQVAHDQTRPFVIETNFGAVKVLGTEFNLKAAIDATYTTLVEGSVEVSNDRKSAVLEPGRQSKIARNKEDIEVYAVDLKEITAWKEGYFRFKDDDIVSVLNKISDWYDIQGVDFQVELEDRFVGSIKRTRKLSELLNQLEKISNYKFEIKKGRVIVMQ